ncbi:MAG: hypothetical protein H0T85_12145 [Geodermatophilaceae bacterium]|nr:hypothetical protein [Geodermatophilaceae bacterium]
MTVPTATDQRRLSGAGVALLVLGLWGALVPFAGPSFGYGMGGTPAWTWSESHLTLHLLPGLAAIVGGLIVLRGREQAQRLLGAVLAAAGGTWFLVAPTLHPLWAPSAMGGMGSMDMGDSAMSSALSGLGYHYGTGALIALIGAYAVGALAALGTSAPTAAERASAPTASRRG